VEQLVPPQLWHQYYALQEDILQKMREAQKISAEIAKVIKMRELDIETTQD